MGLREISRRAVIAAGATTLVAGVAIAAPAAPALAAASNHLVFDVAVVSAKSAWAVGLQFNGTANQTLIEHWNGTAWKTMKSPDVGGAAANNQLFGVTATSARNAWAVGTYSVGNVQHTLIVRWNGKAWKRVPTPAPACAPGAQLFSVSAVSATSAWAVGFGTACPGQVNTSLILRWNGKTWKKATSPSPQGSPRDRADQRRGDRRAERVGRR